MTPEHPEVPAARQEEGGDEGVKPTQSPTQMLPGSTGLWDAAELHGQAQAGATNADLAGCSPALGEVPIEPQFPCLSNGLQEAEGVLRSQSVGQGTSGM